MDCIYFIVCSSEDKSVVQFWDAQRQAAAQIRDEYERAIVVKNAKASHDARAAADAARRRAHAQKTDCCPHIQR